MYEFFSQCMHPYSFLVVDRICLTSLMPRIFKYKWKQNKASVFLHCLFWQCHDVLHHPDSVCRYHKWGASSQDNSLMWFFWKRAQEQLWVRCSQEKKVAGQLIFFIACLKTNMSHTDSLITTMSDVRKRNMDYDSCTAAEGSWCPYHSEPWMAKISRAQ